MFHRRTPEPPPRRRRARHGRSGRSLGLYLFAGIGAAAVLFLILKYLIIPLLVMAA